MTELEQSNKYGQPYNTTAKKWDIQRNINQGLLVSRIYIPLGSVNKTKGIHAENALTDCETFKSRHQQSLQYLAMVDSNFIQPVETLLLRQQELNRKRR